MRDTIRDVIEKGEGDTKEEIDIKLEKSHNQL